ncbi:hypothetical protein LTR95_006590 [Oleoguttula sp. CCFEE 5521]
MDFPPCLYTLDGSAPSSSTPAKATPVLYENYLQTLSNDIQIYQALQKVRCGHTACKAAVVKYIKEARGREAGGKS